MQIYYLKLFKAKTIRISKFCLIIIIIFIIYVKNKLVVCDFIEYHKK